MTEIHQIQDNLFYDERSAGGIVYKKDGENITWLLIKTVSKNRTKIGMVDNGKDLKYAYKFPKGHLEKNEFLKQAALREVEEEGQVKAKIVTKIGSNNYVIWDKLSKKKIIKKVTFFLMEYVSNSDLKYFDNEVVLSREWFNFKDATDKLAYDSEKILLKKAAQSLNDFLKKNK